MPASSSSSDDDDSDGSPVDDAGREVLELVQELEYDAKLSPREAKALRRLVKTNNDRLMAAYDVFQMEKDATDLVDTMQRIARRSVASTSDEDVLGSEDENGDESSPESETHDNIYALRVLQDLTQQGHLSLAQARVLLPELKVQNEALVSRAADRCHWLRCA